jgi:sodium-dependent phosphate transporter
MARSLGSSMARGLGILLIMMTLSEIAATRSEFNEDDWTFYIVAAGICAFFAAFGIGANDVANAYATSVGSKAITVRQAVMLAAVFEFAGAVLMGSNVAKTIRKGIADASCFEDNPGLMIYGMTCVIISVAIWLILASYFELPVSTTHSCVGGVIGMALMTRGSRCVIWNYTRNDYGNGTTNMAFENFPWLDGVAEIVASWFLSPIASGICAAILYGIVKFAVMRGDAYFRCKIFFPLIVLVVVWINVSYWILKGTKGQCERFRTCRLTREAKAGNLWPALLVGLYPSIAAGVVAGAMVPTLSKRIDSGDVVGANKALAERAAAGVRQQADEENTRDAEPAQKEEKKKSGMSYITGQLDRDTHKDLDTDAKVAAIHDNVTRHDPRAEQFFRYVQIFTAIVDSFSHGANDVANAMGPFAAAYVAYKKGKVVKQAEMDPGTMLWILALGGVGIVVGLATYGYKIMNAMGVKLIAITPSRGSCIELGAALVVIYGTGQGWPLSTTHCQIGATVAVGLFEGCQGVNKELFLRACGGWVMTLVVVGCTTAMLVGPSPEPLKNEYCKDWSP